MSWFSGSNSNQKPNGNKVNKAASAWDEPIPDSFSGDKYANNDGKEDLWADKWQQADNSIRNAENRQSQQRRSLPLDDRTGQETENRSNWPNSYDKGFGDTNGLSGSKVVGSQNYNGMGVEPSLSPRPLPTQQDEVKAALKEFELLAADFKAIIRDPRLDKKDKDARIAKLMERAKVVKDKLPYNMLCPAFTLMAFFEGSFFGLAGGLLLATRMHMTAVPRQSFNALAAKRFFYYTTMPAFRLGTAWATFFGGQCYMGGFRQEKDFLNTTVAGAAAGLCLTPIGATPTLMGRLAVLGAGIGFVYPLLFPNILEARSAKVRSQWQPEKPTWQ